MKIFGREPAVLVGLIESALVLVLSFGLFNLTQDTVGAIMAVVTAAFGLYLAYVTKDTILGAAVGLLKAGLVLATFYGFSLSFEQSAALIAFVTVGLSLYQRTQTTPLETPSLSVREV